MVLLFSLSELSDDIRRRFRRDPDCFRVSDILLLPEEDEDTIPVCVLLSLGPFITSE